MLRSLWTASTGMKAQMTNLDVISNNLANVNTTGFKKSMVNFQDLLYETLKAAGESTGPDSKDPVGQQVGAGTQIAGITKDFSIGEITRTDRDLDIAIKGKGFFQILDVDSEVKYTRDGSFQLSSDGKIVNSDGLELIGLGNVPAEAMGVSVSATGNISYIDDSGNENSLGDVQLALFVNPSGLSSLGGNLYAKTPSSGEAQLVEPGQQSVGTLQQRFLELSNVNLVEEMVGMITTQRAYEVNSRGIRTADEMLGTAVQIGG
jgi:flagellar basal-body rod protein FlgG